MDLPTLLHIDPQDDDRVLLARIHRLHAPPSRLLQFQTSEAARQAIDSGLFPTLSLVATRVGDEEGVPFVTWLRAHIGRKGKIFLLTGSLDEAITKEALAAGADGVIYRTSDLERMSMTLSQVFASNLISP